MTAALQLEEHSRLDLLAARSRRLANVVEAISKRRDVRERRATMLLVILSMRCPLGAASLRERWYVPGAAARLGPAALWRAWRGKYGDPPSERTIRAHLGMLERHALIMRSPGDLIPVLFDAEHPEKRPRHADTIHVLEEEAEAEYWATTGRELLKRNPSAKYSPRRWAQLFDGWRDGAEKAQRQLVLPFAAEELLREPGEVATGPEAAARELARAATCAPSVLALLSSLDRVGACLRGPNRQRLARDPWRLACATALLAIALRRQAASPDDRNRVRRRAAWLVRAHDRATEAELAAALEWAVEASGIPRPETVRRS